MAIKTGIHWTKSTWNPLTGCTKISEGCKNCYAEKMAKRIKAAGIKRYKNGFQLTLQPDLLLVPLKWKKPRLIFVNSMSDLFHKDVPLEYIQQVFSVMNQAHQHTFQILTKRSERLTEIASYVNWTPNIWMGVTIENQKVKHRIEHLKEIPARIRFLSCEPLLESLGTLNLEGIQWVITGGESGVNARPVEKEWVIEIKDQCLEQEVSFFFKQWGGIHPNKKGRELEGRTWDEIPCLNTNNQS